MKTLIAVAGVLAVIVLVVVSSYIGAYNRGVGFETTIEAQYKDMENVLAQYSLKVKEAVQIPGLKADDLSRITKDAMSGRYGANGSKAAFQWIKENYPGQVTDELYSKIQTLIEAGRNKFENHQRIFIDQMRAYKAEQRYFWSGFWMRLAGYPSAEFIRADYKIISSEHARESFESGVDKGLKLR